MESSQPSERKLSSPIEDGQQIHQHGGGWITFPFISGTMLGQSLAAGGWLSNLIVLLITEFNVKSITATKINNLVLGCTSLFPIAAAILADSILGSFSVISIFSFVSLLGMIMLTLTATIDSLRPAPCAMNSDKCETPSTLQFSVLYMAITLGALGLGGTRFTIATMGANQFDKPREKGIFFNWYFIILFLANAISYTAIIYIEDNISWALGFGICVAVNAIGFIVFLSGTRLYRHVKPEGSPFTGMARVIVASIRKSNLSTTIHVSYYSGNSKLTNCSPSKTLSFFNRAALMDSTIIEAESSDPKSWGLCSIHEVEDLKSVIKIFPLWTTGFCLSTTIGMISSFTILQALTMDRSAFSHNFKIPAASFLVFNLLSTAGSIFVIDRFILPMWRNVTGTHLTPLQRVGIGHVINIMSMVSAALIEIKRLNTVKIHGLMGQPGSVVPMSGLWLVIPLVLLGIGEGFHFPANVTFYYQEFPTSIRSTSTAMISILIAIGFYGSTALTDLIGRTTGWLPDDINRGRLDNVYWVLATIGLVNFVYYLTCAKLFKCQNPENEPSKS